MIMNKNKQTNKQTNKLVALLYVKVDFSLLELLRIEVKLCAFSRDQDESNTCL